MIQHLLNHGKYYMITIIMYNVCNIWSTGQLCDAFAICEAQGNIF